MYVVHKKEFGGFSIEWVSDRDEQSVNREFRDFLIVRTPDWVEIFKINNHPFEAFIDGVVWVSYLYLGESCPKHNDIVDVLQRLRSYRSEENL
jgi:hypothetical protein